jgi:hypothetical protein
LARPVLAGDTQAAGQPGEKELSGKVLGVEEKVLWIEGEEGEAVPIRITHKTMVLGQRIKDDQRIRTHLGKLMPGEEVRASFTLKKGHLGKYENEAVSVEKSVAVEAVEKE